MSPCLSLGQYGQDRCCINYACILLIFLEDVRRLRAPRGSGESNSFRETLNFGKPEGDDTS